MTRSVTGSLRERVWRFRPRTLVLRSDRVERFADRVGAALEAGHSLPGGIRLAYRSGSRGGVEVGTLGGTMERWWSGAVVTLFAPGQWSRELDPRSLSPSSTWVGRPLLRFPQPVWHVRPSTIAQRLGLVLGTLPGGLTLTWTLRPSRPYVESLPPEVTPPPSRAAFTNRRAFGVHRPNPGAPSVDADLTLARRVWATHVSLGRSGDTLGPSEEERTVLERALLGAGGNGIRFGRPRPWPFGADAEFPLRGTELAGLLPGPEGEGWPIDAETIPPIGSISLGRDERGNAWVLPLTPSEGRHLAVLGETGMGKSSFLIALARAVSREHGVVFLDPMGDAAREYLSALPPDLARRALWLSPTESPQGLNALGGPSPRPETDASTARRISDLVEALRRVRAGHYVERSFWTPRIEEMLGRALGAAFSSRGTMVDAHQLLEEAMAGGRPGSQATEPVCALFDRVHQRPEDAEGARRLLFEFTSSPDLVRMLCDRSSTLRARDLVAPQGLTVISGDAARVGEATTRRLLAAYLALVWGELMARARPSKTFVLLDEVQWFGHEALGEMLRIGRRFNVHVVLGTQSLRALPEELSDAVRTNVADLLLFRGSPDEAREFGRTVPGLSTEDLLALGRGEAIFLEGKGRRIQFVRIERPSRRTSGPDRRYAGGPDTGRWSTLPPTGSVASFPRRDGSARGTAADLFGSSPAGRAAVGPSPSCRVYLAELTAGSERSGRTVRELGGELGRRGWIRSKGVDGRGAYWELGPEGLEALRGRLEPRYGRPPTAP